MFTQQQIENFKAYRIVQMSGRFNMFDRQARELTGLSSSEYTFVMQNYAGLREAADNLNETRTILNG